MSGQSTNKAVAPEKDPAVKNLDESLDQRVGRFNSRQEARKRRFNERAEEAHGDPDLASGPLEVTKVPRVDIKSPSEISKVMHRTGEHVRNVFDLNLSGNVGFMANRKPLTKEEIRARSHAQRLGMNANFAAVGNGNAALPASESAPQPVAGEQAARQNSGNDQNGLQAGRQAGNSSGHSFGRGQVRDQVRGRARGRARVRGRVRGLDRGRGRARGRAHGRDSDFERGFTSGFARGFDQGFARGLASGSSNNQSGNGSASANVSRESHSDSRTHRDEPEADREPLMGGYREIFD